MSTLAVHDLSALAASLDALPEGTWIDVTTQVSYRLERVPGGWYLPGDVTIASGDITDGHPTRVEVLD